MAIDIYRNIRNTPLYKLVRLSDDHYKVNFALREYHGTHHATMVVHNVNVLTDNDPSMALVIAAQWHDAVYFPGAGSDANERCSSAALGIEARTISVQDPFTQEQKDAVNKAQDLIEYTAVKYHLHDKRIGGELAVLLDADLASLANPYDEFIVAQEWIIRENGGRVTDETYARCAEFLRQFLNCRKYIYHTAKARELWEKKARINIETLCNNTGVEIGNTETE